MHHGKLQIGKKYNKRFILKVRKFQDPRLDRLSRANNQNWYWKTPDTTH